MWFQEDSYHTKLQQHGATLDLRSENKLRCLVNNNKPPWLPQIQLTFRSNIRKKSAIPLRLQSCLIPVIFWILPDTVGREPFASISKNRSGTSKAFSSKSNSPPSWFHLSHRWIALVWAALFLWDSAVLYVCGNKVWTDMRNPSGSCYKMATQCHLQVESILFWDKNGTSYHKNA